MDELHILIDIILDEGIRRKATDQFSLSVYGNVILIGEAHEEYEKLCNLTDLDSVKEARSLTRAFEWFTAGEMLGARYFKYQGRHKVGHIGLTVHAFKSHQYRIYGCCYCIEKQRLFLGTVCDPKKKQNKADQEKLDKAAQESLSWLEKLNSGLGMKS